MKIEQYKCPNCGGIVRFDSSSGALLCLSCKTVFEPTAFDQQDEEADAAELDYDNFELVKFKARKKKKGRGARKNLGLETAAMPGAWDEADQKGLCGGSCPSCGAEFFGNENTVATVCQCCGNAEIVAERLSGGLKPDCIIPFKLEKNAAVAAIKKFCKGKPLLPKGFASDNRIEEVQGMYAPFWLFDAMVEGNINYGVIDLFEFFDSPLNMLYFMKANGVLTFDRIPVDASKKMDDDYMDSMESFDYSEMVPFNKSFLAGYVAEKYDVSANTCKDRAENRMRNSIKNELRQSVRDQLEVTKIFGVRCSLDNIKYTRAHYGLLPVWILNTRSNGRHYRFMMNGQTGHMAGRLPADSGKAWIYGSAITCAMGAVLTALLLAMDAVGIFREPPVPIIIGVSLVTFINLVWFFRNIILAFIPALSVFFLWTLLAVPPLYVTISALWLVSAITSLAVIRKWKREM
ncbi:MAG: hypothetical protein FWB94_12350, partial [Chitinispirillia bacterium]|nr:hypothetical protein [Chitinispirillia bacterium]